MSFIETDKRHLIMWRKIVTNQIKSNQIAYMSHRAKHVNSSREKTSIDKRLFVQFITAVRQIEASSRVAEDNINNFEVVK